MRFSDFTICLLMLALLTIPAPPANACLWDRDTLAHEGEGIPEIVSTIVGRFDRFPPRYYEMRRDRILNEFKQINDAEPSAVPLSLYDDLAVAYDRLGDADTAIYWMKEKQSRLATATPDEHYRTLANLGTFHAHRWIKAGAKADDKEDMQDIEIACDLIAECLELNPNAHFGREEYQLLALEWIRDHIRELREVPPNHFSEPWDVRTHLGTWDYFPGSVFPPERTPVNTTKGAPPSSATKGFAGLIRLGAAWESVDIFYALLRALRTEGRHSIGFLAHQRLEELENHGRHSLVGPSFDVMQVLEGYGAATLHPHKREPAYLSFFQKARAEADAWRAHRISYMESKLARGQHPDTHPDFWTDYQEVSQAPQLPDRRFYESQAFWGGVISILATLLLVKIVVTLGKALLSAMGIRRKSPSPKTSAT